MSALHRAWVEAQADAIKYQREMRELDTYANPYRRAALVPRQRAAQDHADRKTARAKRIASLEKQITKLKALQFTVDHGEEA